MSFLFKKKNEKLIEDISNEMTKLKDNIIKDNIGLNKKEAFGILSKFSELLSGLTYEYIQSENELEINKLLNNIKKTLEEINKIK